MTNQPDSKERREKKLTAVLIATLMAAVLAIALAQSLQTGDTLVTLGSENVTIDQAGTYVIQGELADDMVEVRAPGADLTLVLDGAHR